MATRRQYLKVLGAGAAGGAALPAVSGLAAADHGEQQPSHVTLEYDQAFLETYRPMLVLRELDVKPLALYSWKATSPEYDTAVGVYWAEYTHQEGVSEYDSHFGDHEPVYVFVDEQSGDVEEVVYSGYHWLAARTRTPDLYAETHPKLHVVSPWHHYFTTTEQGTLVETGDLTSEFQAWLDNGLEDDLAPGTVVNPWRMRTRSDWWRDDVAGISFNAIYVNVALKIGLHEADRTDLTG